MAPRSQQRADELARLVAGHAPLTLRATKEALRRLQPQLVREEGEDLILMCYMSRGFPRRHGRLPQQAPAAMDGRVERAPLQRSREETHGPAERLEGGRSDARHGGADLHADARRHGRRRHQDREDARTATTRAACVPPKIGDEAASFLMMNRNKRGIALDLKTEGGAEVLRRLLARRRRPGREFRPGRDGAARLRLRGPEARTIPA